MPSSPEEATLHTPHPQHEHLLGVVERVTFHSEESGYTVARFNVPLERELVTIIGRFPEIHAGQTLRLTGVFREHPKYGRQFHCLHAQETKPATLTGLEKYLGSGLISQGSEYSVVILALFMQHYILLSRNLLYTGLTRAKQLAILVGPTKAIGLAIKRVTDRQRYTALADRLKALSEQQVSDR